MPPPKILFISEAPYRGGAEEYILQVVRKVRDRLRWRVCVALPSCQALDSLRRDLEAADAEVITREIPELPDKGAIPGLRQAHYYAAQLKHVREAQKLYRQVAPDIVHVNLHKLTAGKALLMAATLQKIPTVAVVQLAHKRVNFRRLEQAQFTFVARCGYTHWITVSEDSKCYVVESYKLAADAVTVIPNGADLTRFVLPAEQIASTREAVRREFSLPADTKLITTVAAMDGRKGQDVLAECIEPVVTLYPNVHFLWVGDGEQRQAIEDVVTNLGVAKYVTFAGFRPDVPALVNASDLFVLPTFFESMPFALIEAMAAGLPCIASRVNGIPEVLRDGIDGLLVPPKDAPALTKALLTLLGDPALAAEYGQAASQRSAVFSAEEMWRKLSQCYQSVLAG